MNQYRDCTTIELLVIDAGRDYHDPELCAELCSRAGLSAEWEAADGESFFGVLALAIEKLTGA